MTSQCVVAVVTPNGTTMTTKTCLAAIVMSIDLGDLLLVEGKEDLLVF